MGTYIDVSSVRRTSGISESQVNDTDVESTITEIEKKVPRFFNTVFTPTERIDILDGDGTNRMLLDKNPLLSVRQLKIDGTTVDPADLEIHKDSGYIFLGNESDVGKFTEKRNKNVIKYVYGTMEYSSTSTTSSEAEIAGTSVSVAVASITDFSDEDWVEIYGMDGFREVAQISGTPAAGVIILDQLVQTHEAGSIVVKLEISEVFKELMNIIASISLVARVVGESAQDTVGYDLGELRVQKGEPYTQWRETVNQLIKQRDEIYSKISIRPYTL